MKVSVLIPAKPLADVKQRLSPVLDQTQRRLLFEAMLRDLLQQLSRVREIDRILIVGGDTEIEQIAADNDCAWLAERVKEGELRGLNEAVSQGVATLKAAGSQQVLVLHGDLPLAKAAEVSELIHRHQAAKQQLSLVTDSAGRGSNAILLNSDIVFDFHYGEGSLERHVQQAESRGLKYQCRRYAGIGADIDTPEDLASLSKVLARSPQQAPLTGMVLRLYPSVLPRQMDERLISA